MQFLRTSRSTIPWMTLRTVLSFVMLLSSPSIFAQTGGIRGVISDENGNQLAFATIFVKERGTGTTANSEGSFEIVLAPGRYELVFQHLGRKTEVRVVEVQDRIAEIKIIVAS